MTSFEMKSTKHWVAKRDEREFCDINLISSSVTNKFFIVTGFIEKVAAHCGKDFDEWFEEFLTSYRDNEEKRFKIMEKHVPQIKLFVDSYLEFANIDFSQFVDESKAKKSSILFKADEIEKIIKLSSYLKLYAVVSNSAEFKLDQRRHKIIYNMFATEVIDSEIIYKIFGVVKTKTFRYNLTDRYMWDYIKMIQCKTIDIHVVEIFNFIMNSILILCEEDRNPIIYFVSVVEESINWFLRSVYKGSIIYDDSISTEDIHGLNVNNLKTYSFNDTLGRLKGVAYGKIYDMLEKPAAMSLSEASTDRSITEFQSRVTNIQYISPICECLAFPILSRLTNIPYAHFKTLSAEHAAVLSVYVHKLLRKVFKNQYVNLFSLLDYYPNDKVAIATTYKLKAIQNFVNLQNDVNDFFGFKTKILPWKILSFFVGRISRIQFDNIITGERLVGIPLSKVEVDMIQFYSRLFSSDRLDVEIQQMKKIMGADF